MPRQDQVRHVTRLLALRGEEILQEVRQRVSVKKGVMAAGLFFDASVLEEALGQWESAGTANASDSECFMVLPPPLAKGESQKRKAQAEPEKGTARRARPGPLRPMDLNAQAEQTPSSPSLEAQQGQGGALRDRLARRAGLTIECVSFPSRVATPCRKASFGSPFRSPREPSSFVPSWLEHFGDFGDDLPRAREEPEVRPRAVSEPSPPSLSPAKAPSKSIRELKELLAQSGVAPKVIAGCVEKAELQSLWDRMTELRQLSLADLQAASVAAGGCSYGTAEECIRYLLEPSEASSSSSRGLKEPRNCAEAFAPTSALDAQAEAAREVSRILPLRREQFQSSAAWGYEVLGVTGKFDLVSAQRGYRILMRKLHPDKAGASPGVARAAEMAREAREAVERSLSREEPPRAPLALQSFALSTEPGNRRYRLSWRVPGTCENAPVRRYIVAALDPAYGKPLTVAVLEPDYSEELRRFVSVEELTTFVLEEKELQKMPSLWKQQSATVQVAAANDAGQSPWALLQIRLSANFGPANSGVALKRARPEAGATGQSEESPCIDERQFAIELRRRRGPQLRDWLEKQKKSLLTSWLRSLHWPSLGTKEDLVSRIIFVTDGSGQR